MNLILSYSSLEYIITKTVSNSEFLVPSLHILNTFFPPKFNFRYIFRIKRPPSVFSLDKIYDTINHPPCYSNKNFSATLISAIISYNLPLKSF